MRTQVDTTQRRKKKQTINTNKVKPYANKTMATK